MAIASTVIAVLASVVVIRFLVSLVISTIVINFVVKLFGEREGIGTAFMAALAGSIIYGIFGGLLGSILAGIAWLITLRSLYGIGWMKSLAIAVVIWIIANLVSFILPTAIGPL